VKLSLAIARKMGGNCSKKRSYGGGGGQYGGYSERMGSVASPSGVGGGQNGMMQGQNSVRRNFMTGLVGGEYEAQDRLGTFGGGYGSTAAGFADRQGGGYGGGGGYGNYGFQSTCPEGVNQNTALLATAAAIAVGAAILFREITQRQARRRRRRRRRSTSDGTEPEERGDLLDKVFSVAHAGIQKFTAINSK